MPIPVDGSKPTIITKPNQRYAATFLSTKLRRFAVNGEVLKDDTSGEIYLKRKDDGKVVSFFQNKKYMHDLTLELRVLLSNNPGFSYPADSEEAFFLSTNYDMVAINKENLINIYTEDNVIDTASPYPLYTLKFPLSTKTNGFFCRVGTRDCDKPVLEMITNYYNKTFKNYVGTEASFLEQKQRFDEVKWEDSNATLHYMVTCIKGKTCITYSCKDYVRMNESCMVKLPEYDMAQDFPNGMESITVEITKIEYEKIHFMIQNKDTIPGNFLTLLDKFIFQPERIESHTVNIMSFIDDPDDVIELGNETLLAFIDVPYANRYMSKMTALLDGGDFIFSIKRPLATDWVTNGVWAEMVRTIDTNGNITNTGSENSDRLEDLEDIFGPNRIHHGIISTLASRHDDFLLTDIVEIP